MNIIVPLMGKGERFKAAGYGMPKPLISVNGKPMIELAIEPFLDHNFQFTFVIRSEYQGLKLPGRKIVLEQDTQGAACTVLAGLEDLDELDPLIILNSDQILKFSWLNLYSLLDAADPHGVIWVFEGSGNRWSYARLDEDGFVEEVAEKRQISPWATCGAYYFKHGVLFRKAAEHMIAANDRVNNEFYVAPVYNHMRVRGPGRPKILPFESGMQGLGTPEDLEEYLCSLV